MWPYTKSGEYTVKSGYAFIECGHILYPNERIELNKIKQKIWRMHTQPKIKFFFWRAVYGALAVAERLLSRGIQLETACKICNTEIESINHVLFGCFVAQRMLSLARILNPSQGFSQTSALQNIDFLLQIMQDGQLSTEVRHSIPWVLWSI